MRLLTLSAWLLVGIAAQGTGAQVPPGDYVRDYSPGFAGESLAISGDSTFVLHVWSDVTVLGDPYELYLGATGTLHQSGSHLILRYERVLMDTVAWSAREEGSEQVEAWASAQLRALQASPSRLFVGSVEGTPVLTWAEGADSVEVCREALAEPEPEGGLPGLDWHFRRVEACGGVFLPKALNARLQGGA